MEDGVRRLQEIVPKDASLAYTPEVLMEFGSAPDCIVNTAVERRPI